MDNPYTNVTQTYGPAQDPAQGNKIVMGTTVSFVVPAANNAYDSVFFVGKPTVEQVDEELSKQSARMIAIAGLGNT
jgi:hypothetical protein